MLSTVAPLLIQAESFDQGGESVAYHDLDSANVGGAYRPTEGVDLEVARDTGSGYNVRNAAASEWIQYTVDVPATGTYQLDFRVASKGTGGVFHVNVDGANQTGAMVVPNTGGWQRWRTISSSTFDLTAGQHVFRVAMDANGSRGLVGNLNWLRITNVPPAAPTGLTATPAASQAVALSWVDNANNETGYQIERKTGSAGAYQVIASVTAGSKSYNDAALAASTQYFYRVVARQNTITSAYSNEASATTATAPVATAPAAPSGLSATAGSPNTVTLQWTDNAANETGYQVQRKTGATGTYQTIASLAANSVSYSNSGLTASTQYFYRVQALNGTAASAYSNEASVTTPAPVVIAPAAPSSLSATAGGPNAVTLQWTDNAANETAYQVQRKTGATGTYQTITSLSANSAGFSDSGLTASTQYFYRVQALNGTAASAYSNEASATTLSGITVPAAPAQLVALPSNPSEINLSWADTANNESGFHIERSTDGTTFAQIGSVGANVTSYISSGLSAATTYYYRVRAYNTAGTSAFTSIVSAMTSTPSTSTGDMTWTTFTPSADTRRIYVSSSGGNDLNSGLDSTHPVATLAKGYSLLRDGYPDWLLLKSGDTWNNQTLGVWRVSGRSETAPMLVSSYGAGARPIISNTTQDGLAAYGGDGIYSHIALSGLHFVGHGSNTGIFVYGTGTDYLIENTVVEGYNDNIVIQADASKAPRGPSNVRIRGSQILDSYDAAGQKSQGLFASSLDGLLLENNLFDHNGWKEGVMLPDMFSHNVYVINMTDLTVRGNILSNASSYGLLLKSESANATSHVLIENNLFVGDGNGMVVGGYASNGTWNKYGAVDVTIRNNVLTQIGRNIGGSDQSYGILLGSIDGAVVENNLLFNKSNGGTSFGITLDSPVGSQNVTIAGNVIYNWNKGFIRVGGTGPLTNIVVRDNVLQDNLYGSALQVSDGALPNPQVRYSGNKYYSNAPTTNWFQVQGGYKSFANWVALSGETNAVQGRATFADASRTVETYSSSIGGSGTLSSLITAARSQSQQAWRPELMAEAIVTYLETGFNISPLAG